MNIASHSVTAPDGHVIQIRNWHTTQPGVVIQLSHGMAEHCARYDALGQFLLEHNIAMAGADHRGFGNNVPHHGARGHYSDENGWDKVVQDQYYVYTKIHELYPETPVVLLGHSMGSYIAQKFAVEHGDKLAGLILSGSNLNSPALLQFGLLMSRLEKLRLGIHAKSDLLNTLSFGSFNKAFEPARTDFDWLSREDAEVDKYINDPLCGDMSSNQLWIDFLKGLIGLSKPAQIRKIPALLPVFIFGGSHDPAGGKKGLNRLYNFYHETGHQKTQLKIYPKGRHEMLNETNRNEVHQDILSWIKEYT